MIWVLPGALAITLPLELTVAMRLFLLLHFTFLKSLTYVEKAIQDTDDLPFD